MLGCASKLRQNAKTLRELVETLDVQTKTLKDTLASLNLQESDVDCLASLQSFQEAILSSAQQAHDELAGEIDSLRDENAELEQQRLHALAEVSEEAWQSAIEKREAELGLESEKRENQPFLLEKSRETFTDNTEWDSVCRQQQERVSERKKYEEPIVQIEAEAQQLLEELKQVQKQEVLEEEALDRHRDNMYTICPLRPHEVELLAPAPQTDDTEGRSEGCRRFSVSSRRRSSAGSHPWQRPMGVYSSICELSSDALENLEIGERLNEDNEEWEPQCNDACELHALMGGQPPKPIGGFASVSENEGLLKLLKRDQEIQQPESNRRGLKESTPRSSRLESSTQRASRSASRRDDRQAESSRQAMDVSVDVREMTPKPTRNIEGNKADKENVTDHTPRRRPPYQASELGLP